MAPGIKARFASFLCAHPLLVCGLALLSLSPLVVSAPGVRLDNSIRVWMVDDPAKLDTYERFRAAFGSDERLVALVRGRDAKERSDLSLLRFVADLHHALEDPKQFPQVEDVVSVRTLAADEVTVLLDDPEGIAALPRLRPRLEASPLAREFRLLDLARDRATVSFGIRGGPPDERRALLRDLEPFRTRAAREGRELLLAGQPIVNVELDEGARQVDSVFMPLLVGVCVVTMLRLTRSVRVTLLVLVPVGLSVLAVIGLVGATGRSFNLLLVIAKPLTFVLALATGLHVAQSFVNGLRDGLDRAGAAARAIDEKAIPCFFTTLATVDGFGSLVTGSVRPIRDFGLLSAAGMLVAFVLLLGPLVAALAALGPARPTREGPDRFGALSEGLVRWLTASRGRSLGALVACLAACGAGAWAYAGLRVDTNALNYLDPEGQARTDYEAIESEGIGLFASELVVRARDGSAIAASTSALRAILDVEQAVRRRPGVTAVLSFADTLVDAQWRGSGAAVLPAASIVRDALGNEDVLARSGKLLGDGAGAKARALRVIVVARTLETPALLALVGGVEEDFERLAAPAGLVAESTGSYALMLATQLSLVGTLGKSLTGAGLTIAVTLLLLVRSLRRVALAFLPNALPILGNFVLMRAAGIPLDVGTVMVSSIVLGIAVDNSMHFLYHYGRARGRGESVVEANAFAARVAGRSLVLATAIIVAGFLTLLLSRFAPTWRFGLLAAVGLVVALVGAIGVLPALLALFDRGRETAPALDSRTAPVVGP